MRSAVLIAMVAAAGCGEGASVSGRIVDPIQRPIEDAWVKAVFDFECCDGPYESWVEECDRTDGDGDFGLSAYKSFGDLSGDEHVGTTLTIWAPGYRIHRVFWSSYGPDWGFGTYAEEGELCSPACELERCFEGNDCALTEPPDDWCRDGEWDSY